MTVDKAAMILADELNKILNDKALLAKLLRHTDNEKGYTYLYISIPQSVAKYVCEALDVNTFDEDRGYIYKISIYDPKHLQSTEPPEMWVEAYGFFSDYIDLPFDATDVTSDVISMLESIGKVPIW